MTWRIDPEFHEFVIDEEGRTVADCLSSSNAALIVALHAMIPTRDILAHLTGAYFIAEEQIEPHVLEWMNRVDAHLRTRGQ